VRIREAEQSVSKGVHPGPPEDELRPKEYLLKSLASEVALGRGWDHFGVVRFSSGMATKKAK